MNSLPSSSSPPSQYLSCIKKKKKFNFSFHFVSFLFRFPFRHTQWKWRKIKHSNNKNERTKKKKKFLILDAFSWKCRFRFMHRRSIVNERKTTECVGVTWMGSSNSEKFFSTSWCLKYHSENEFEIYLNWFLNNDKELKKCKKMNRFCFQIVSFIYLITIQIIICCIAMLFQK